MLPNFLLPESEIQKDGEGTAVALENGIGKTLQITLGITDVNEQASLEILVHGSLNGAEWDPKPIAQFPQKFYKGTYTVLLDLTSRPEVAYLKVKYKAARWGHWTTPPDFRCYVFAEILAS
ncbi:MAG TPA: hypothetical protein VES20_00490 [Bryobacteraceae bacterium]|nr:hypothetical protein [Bryobacteraceae bacterium]